MLLPGKVGFVDENAWRFNPSYLPPQLASYFTRFGAPWTTLRESNRQPLFFWYCTQSGEKPFGALSSSKRRLVSRRVVHGAPKRVK